MKLGSFNDHIEDIQKKIGYTFKNKELLYQAFTRSSYTAETGDESNETLEFIGDRVLDYVVVKLIVEYFSYIDTLPQLGTLLGISIEADKHKSGPLRFQGYLNEKQLSELKQQLVSNEALAKRSEELGFNKYLFMGQTDIKDKVNENTKVKADVLEAIIGAVAIDTKWDIQILTKVVDNILGIYEYFAELDLDESRPEEYTLDNAINTLKELAEHGHCSMPTYDFKEKVYEDGSSKWTCTVAVTSWDLKVDASASSKKDSKKYAAYKILAKHFNMHDEYTVYD